jgi:3-isopropylmalate dehydrogenase
LRKKVLDKIAAKFGHTFTYDEALIGHVAIEATGVPLPDESLEKMKKSDAVLFGAVGHPKYDNDPSAKSSPRARLAEDAQGVGFICQPAPDQIV